MKDKDKLIEIITKYFHPPFDNFALQNIKSSIKLSSHLNKKIDIGESKFGGIPDFPKELSWPREKGKELSFLCQINLNQIAELGLVTDLPTCGILYFFFDYHSWDYGMCIYSEKDDNLYQPTPSDELSSETKSWFQKLFRLKGKKKLLNECAAELTIDYNTSLDDSIQLIKFCIENEIDFPKKSIIDEIVYENNLLTDGVEPLDSDHHLLGNYQAIQEGLFEFLLNNEPYNFKNINKNSIETLNKALEWKLLLQFDSDKNFNISFGDWGRFYFFIKKEDLDKRDFSKVQMFGDCY